MQLLKKWIGGIRKSPRQYRSIRLQVEGLESRLTPYSVSGNSWLQPQLVSLSFVPDGTNLGGVTSNLFATMDAKWPTATWQKEILRATQVWAQQTNLNFTIVGDDGSDAGSGSYQQGASNFGDIRIGAYSSGGSWLGMAYLPQPACNYSLAGDWLLNASQNWKINQTGGYDLFTVSAHEVGHGLGLLHSTVSSAVMYGSYTGIKSSLRSDDIYGIRAIYSGGSARSHDGYDAVAANGTFDTATDISSTVDPSSLTALLTDLDTTTVSDLDYYKVTVPEGTTGTMEVKIQSSGLSMLSPLVRVYDAAKVEIGSASGLNQYGTTLTVTLGGVSAGQQYYIKMDGADNTAFGTGKYAMTLNFGSNPTPTVPLPNTQTPNGSPLQCGGGIAHDGHDHDHEGVLDHGHGYGPARAGEVSEPDLAGVVQFLTVPPQAQTVLAVGRISNPSGRFEKPSYEVPPAVATVDVLFARDTHPEAERVQAETVAAETPKLDTLFAELVI